MSATDAHAEIPPAAFPLLAAPHFATVATIQPDGSPQLSVVWIARDGDDVLFSTIKGRRKTLNMERDPRVSVMVYDAVNPYAYVEVRGTVSLTEEGGPELIHRLSEEYTGGRFPGDDGTDHVRVVCRVTPTKVITRSL
jgi:PPOX class probable F420-dependent enzyme